MVLKEVPRWARKCIGIGILLPIISFFMLQSYDAHTGVWDNMMRQNVELPLLKGQNPVVCMRESVQLIINGSLGFDKAISSYSCQRATIVPYRFVGMISIFMIVLGVYMYARGDQLANLWPTEWKPFDEKNVREEAKQRARTKGQPLKLENPDDKPINPKEGGF